MSAANETDLHGLSLETGLALPVLPDTVGTCGSETLRAQRSRCLGWAVRWRCIGATSTPPFAILDRARRALPQPQALLMDTGRSYCTVRHGYRGRLNVRMFGWKCSSSLSAALAAKAKLRLGWADSLPLALRRIQSAAASTRVYEIDSLYGSPVSEHH